MATHEDMSPTPAALQTTGDLGGKSNGDVGHTVTGKSQIAAKAAKHAEDLARGTTGSAKSLMEKSGSATLPAISATARLLAKLIRV